MLCYHLLDSLCHGGHKNITQTYTNVFYYVMILDVGAKSWRTYLIIQVVVQVVAEQQVDKGFLAVLIMSED